MGEQLQGDALQENGNKCLGLSSFKPKQTKTAQPHRGQYSSHGFKPAADFTALYEHGETEGKKLLQLFEAQGLH